MMNDAKCVIEGRDWEQSRVTVIHSNTDISTKGIAMALRGTILLASVSWNNKDGGFTNVGTEGHMDHSVLPPEFSYEGDYKQLAPYKESLASPSEVVLGYIKPKKGEGKQRGYGLGKHRRGK